MALAMRRLQRAGIDVSVLGFGAAPLGGLFSEVSDVEARATVGAARSGGITYFDTAPLYGHGLSEHRLGEALRTVSRDRFVISTKVGRLLTPHRTPATASDLFAAPLPFDWHYDYSADAARRSLEDSLQRLGLACVDIALIHDVVPRWHGDAFEQRYKEAMSGAYAALHRMRAEGLINAIGVGVKDADVAARFVRDGDFDCVMLAGQYTLLNQDALPVLLPLCQSRATAVLLAAPFNSGILATGSVIGARYFYQLAPADVIARVQRIEAICARHHVSLAAVALQFPLQHPAVVSVVAGARTAAEVNTNIAALAAPIPAALWSELKATGLLPADAPVPDA